MNDHTPPTTADVYYAGRPLPWAAPSEHRSWIIEMLMFEDDPAVREVTRRRLFYIREWGVVLTPAIVQDVMVGAIGEPERRAEYQAIHTEEARLKRQKSVVYYVRIGEHIKIGVTIDTKQRFSGLAVDEVLATEPGDQQLEQLRLAQFKHLRVKRREYHRPDADLLSHIAMIREHFGPPTV